MGGQQLPASIRQPSLGGVIVDFEAAWMRCRAHRVTPAEAGAAQALADVRSGRAAVGEVMAALIAPFNPQRPGDS